MREHDHQPSACEHCGPRLSPMLKRVGIVFVVVFLASFLPGLEMLNHGLVSYMKRIAWAVALGLFLGGMIKVFVPESLVLRLLGRGKISSIFNAVVAGFLLSACSHGILALAIQFHKKGAGTPAVIAFLLASPWANLPVTVLFFGFFGWKAFLLIGAAMLIAFTTGVGFLLLDRMGWLEASPEHSEGSQVHQAHRLPKSWKDRGKGVWRGSLNLGNMVLGWILLGVLLAALLHAFLPTAILTRYFGADPLGLLATLAVATVIEVCSEGTAPLAFEIYEKVGALGNPFVFLMAGVVTDYTEIGLLWSNIGRRTALWLPALAVPQVVLLAWGMNLIR